MQNEQKTLGSQNKDAMKKENQCQKSEAWKMNELLAITSFLSRVVSKWILKG